MGLMVPQMQPVSKPTARQVLRVRETSLHCKDVWGKRGVPADRCAASIGKSLAGDV